MNTKTIQEEIRGDIKFLLSFMPAKKPSEVEEGLSPMFYLTGTYEGDVRLAERIEDICTRYGIVEEPEEEDYADVE